MYRGGRYRNTVQRRSVGVNTEIPFLYRSPKTSIYALSGQLGQKGSVENLNGRARRYLPREIPLAALSGSAMKEVCGKLNATPRKCLGYRTPSEAFAEELKKIRYTPSPEEPEFAGLTFRI